MNSTELREAIAAKQDEVSALRSQLWELERIERAQAEAERHSAAFATIAEAVGGDPSKVGTFLADVAQRTGTSVTRLVNAVAV